MSCLSGSNMAKGEFIEKCPQFATWQELSRRGPEMSNIKYVGDDLRRRRRIESDIDRRTNRRQRFPSGVALELRVSRQRVASLWASARASGNSVSKSPPHRRRTAPFTECRDGRLYLLHA